MTCLQPHPLLQCREMDMREISAWTVKFSLLIFTIVGYILTTERPRVSVCFIREFCVLSGVPGYID